MKALVFALLFLPVFAYTVDISASASVDVYEDWIISAVVLDGLTPVTSPTCSLEIKKGENIEQFYIMDIYTDRAESTTSFSSTGTRIATVNCYGDEDQKVFEVNPNSKIFMSLSSVSRIGDTLTISADYKDMSDDPITSGYCTAYIDPDEGAYESLNLFYDSGSREFRGYYTVVNSGYHDVDIDCSDSYHTSQSRSQNFDINKVPVTITPTETSVEGNFGDYRSISIAISPYTTTCYSDQGNMVKTSSYYYTLTAEIDFLGEKDIQVYCSAPGYDSNSENIKFISSEVETRVELQFSTERPFSFQQFSIKPNYYDKNWNPITNGDCELILEDVTKTVKSSKEAYFKAPAGPLETSVSVSCSKYGYKTFEGVALFDIKPIEITLNLKHPPDAKEGEFVSIEATVFPKIQADCDLEGTLLSPSGVRITKVTDNNYLFGEGTFEVQLNESGDFSFSVKCVAEGYKDVKEKGEINITLLSETEEIQAAIILTTLTAILAIGFMLIRKWI
ncbi:MAG: hypothetical protein GOU98_00630 [Candidatus Altiarchaeota archaeon]|nr:hypothetical protein [Candidatus Altiarchaeota archaeon]